MGSSGRSNIMDISSHFSNPSLSISASYLLGGQAVIYHHHQLECQPRGVRLLDQPIGKEEVEKLGQTSHEIHAGIVSSLVTGRRIQFVQLGLWIQCLQALGEKFTVILMF